MNDIKIRKARKKDRHVISRLTGLYPNTLYRSAKEIEKNINNYLIAVNQKEKVIGCCGYKIWDDSAEIISWIIEKQYRKRGLGLLLLQNVIKNLKKKAEIKNIFVVTTRQLADRIFKKIGFVEVGIQMFPEKVLLDCKKCKKNYCSFGKYACDEIALLYKNGIEI